MASNSARLCLRQSTPASQRLFSTSVARRKNGPITEFPPTSSPELDTILSTLRTNVFLPAHLGKSHKQLVYRPSLHQYLTGDEPVKVSLRTVVPSPPSSHEKAPHNLPGPPKKPGDFSPQINNKNKQSYILAPVDRFRDEPKTRPTYTEILHLMKVPSDFDVLPDLLRELSISKRKVTTGMIAQTVRQASDVGCFGAVVEIFRRIKNTGCQINHPEVAREVMIGAVLRASRDEWSEEAVRKAVKNAGTAVRMMGETRHKAYKLHLEEEMNALKLPEVNGSMMTLYAVLASRVQAGENVVGEVTEWMRKMLKYQDKADLALAEESLADANHKLSVWAPVWVGGKLAMNVVADGAEKKQLSKFVADAESLVQRAKEAVEAQTPEGTERRGLKLYNELEKLL